LQNGLVISFKFIKRFGYCHFAHVSSVLQIKSVPPYTYQMLRDRFGVRTFDGQLSRTLPPLFDQMPSDRYGRQTEYHSILRAATSLQIAAFHEGKGRVALPGRLVAFKLSDSNRRLSAGSGHRLQKQCNSG
jgi:hypothetical protein